jgi:hypothetical protein
VPRLPPLRLLKAQGLGGWRVGCVGGDGGVRALPRFRAPVAVVVVAAATAAWRCECVWGVVGSGGGGGAGTVNGEGNFGG